jgi:hypothetical protein
MATGLMERKHAMECPSTQVLGQKQATAETLRERNLSPCPQKI